MHTDTHQHQCPTCGPDFDTSGLIIDLNTNTVCGGTVQATVTPTVAELLHTLLRRSPAIMSRENVMCAMYGARNDLPDDHILHVLVCRARKALSGTGWKIETVHGTGWRLIPD